VNEKKKCGEKFPSDRSDSRFRQRKEACPDCHSPIQACEGIDQGKKKKKDVQQPLRRRVGVDGKSKKKKEERIKQIDPMVGTTNKHYAKKRGEEKDVLCDSRLRDENPTGEDTKVVPRYSSAGKRDASEKPERRRKALSHARSLGPMIGKNQRYSGKDP